jgi:tetratricopeptide (TPR) repeat protein
MSASRIWRFGAVAIALGVAMFLAAAVIVTPDRSAPAPPEGRGSVSAAAVAGPGDMTDAIASLQERLRRIPADSGSWASLGLAYVQQARVSGDPSYYGKAAGAFRRSLRESPVDNAPALTGQAALAAARHDFGRSLRLTRQAQRINEYDSVNLGVLVDALVELGRYPTAFKELQRMVALKPGVPSYARVSYSYELRGDLKGAQFAMRRAFKIAYSADDKAFASFQLGELAWNQGDLPEAARWYREGKTLSPSFVPNLYGLAKTEAARGNAERAIAHYERVVARLPLPQYVIEYSDFLVSLGRTEEAAEQHDLIDAQERIQRAAGVNLDLELALYDADHGKERKALVQARKAWGERRSVFVEDAYAWALHVNGKDREALAHAIAAARIGTRSALFAFHRGMIEKSLGMVPEARRSLQRALDINPYFSPILAPQAREALDKLRQDG